MKEKELMLTGTHLTLVLRLSIALSIATASFQLCHSANAEGLPDSIADTKADYQRKLAEYQAAQQRYEDLAQPYWKSIEEKRLLRNAKRRSGALIIADDY